MKGLRKSGFLTTMALLLAFSMTVSVCPSVTLASSSWSKVGGTSWPPARYGTNIRANSLFNANGKIYAGADDGVWAWDGSSWSQVGSASWPTYQGLSEVAFSTISANGIIYAATHGGVWAWDGSSWSQAGSASWPGALPVNLCSANGKIYAEDNGNQVWAWDGTSWSKAGADNSAFDNTQGTYNWNGNIVTPWASPPGGGLAPYGANCEISANGIIYAGTWSTGIWATSDGSTWSQVGGGTFELLGNILCLLYANGTLYIGTDTGVEAYSVPPQTTAAATASISTTAQPAITVKINGSPLQMDVQPVIIAGRTLVPLRAIFEALGAQVQWDADSQSITATKDKTTINLAIGSTDATITYTYDKPISRQVTLDVPAQIIDGHTYVPLRFVGRALGEDVNWDSATQTISLTPPAIHDGP